MTPVVRVPPTEDFTQFNALVLAQSSHFDLMVDWAGNECRKTDGLEGLTKPLVKKVEAASDFIGGKLKDCRKGMDTIQGKMYDASRTFQNTETDNTAAFTSIFGGKLAGIPDISTITQHDLIGTFDDDNVILKTPNVDTEYQEGALRMSKDLSAYHNQYKGVKGAKGPVSHELTAIDKIYRFVTGHSLISQLFEPLAGDWGRLSYLHEAYKTLSDGCYTVSANLTKGLWKLGGEWEGEGGEAFDSYMFKWSQGIGGIGDYARVVADACDVGYHAILMLVRSAVTAIDALINKALDLLKDKVEKMAAKMAAIEVVGGGPEDPVADVVAVGFALWDIIDIYKKVNTIVNDVARIVGIFTNISTKIDEISKALDPVAYNVQEFFAPGSQSISDWFSQSVVSPESKPGWNPALGMARVKMLPQ
ncbi:hypothetical protein GPX89_17085 [Nocardia sp. ET3-3]|uniref:WXG100 family type VII secretion target n=1 Tax=Nocardia terrae TaxID=2675851 RepID=A0A7K1UX46_9NOCA|nr:hypothetical protein [Nocardia terrae]MVU78954.1 hypothetical protein [Nocardia terrae]